MAPPDLNSVPSSPHLVHTSQPPEPELNSTSSTTQRASHIMGPPPMPANAMSSTIASDPAGAGFGPGQFAYNIVRAKRRYIYTYSDRPSASPPPYDCR